MWPMWVQPQDPIWTLAHSLKEFLIEELRITSHIVGCSPKQKGKLKAVPKGHNRHTFLATEIFLKNVHNVHTQSFGGRNLITTSN